MPESNHNTPTGPQYSSMEDFTAFTVIFYVFISCGVLAFIWWIAKILKRLIFHPQRVLPFSEQRIYELEARKTIELENLKSKSERGLVARLLRSQQGTVVKPPPPRETNVERLRADSTIFVPNMNKFHLELDDREKRSAAARSKLELGKILELQQEEAQKVFRNFNRKRARNRFEQRLKEEKEEEQSELPDSSRTLARAQDTGEESNDIEKASPHIKKPLPLPKKLKRRRKSVSPVKRSPIPNEAKRRLSMAEVTLSSTMARLPPRTRFSSIGLLPPLYQTRIHQEPWKLSAGKSRINVENSFDSGSEPSRERSLSEISHLSKHVNPLLASLACHSYPALAKGAAAGRKESMLTAPSLEHTKQSQPKPTAFSRTETAPQGFSTDI